MHDCTTYGDPTKYNLRFALAPQIDQLLPDSGNPVASWYAVSALQDDAECD